MTKSSLFLAQRQRENWFYLGLGVAQLLVGLQGMAESIAVDPVDKYLASTLWGGLALAGLLSAMNLRDRLLARAAVMIFAIVAMKVLFNDISSSDTITRVIGLIVIGALLYTGGLLLRRINSWK